MKNVFRTVNNKASSYMSHSFYEGWNFNSGNYLITTDTK